jgi:hypothetical protein
MVFGNPASIVLNVEYYTNIISAERKIKGLSAPNRVLI